MNAFQSFPIPCRRAATHRRNFANIPIGRLGRAGTFHFRLVPHHQPTSLAPCRTFARSALPCSGSSPLALRILACGELLGFRRTVLQMVANSNLSRSRFRQLEEIFVNPAVGYSEASVSNLKQTPFAGGPHTRKVIALFCYRIKKWGGAFAVRSRVSVRLIRAIEAPMKGSTVCRILGPA